MNPSVLVIAATILTTALDSERTFKIKDLPLTPFYLGLQEKAGLDLTDFNAFLSMLEVAGFLQCTSETLRLTNLGRVKAEALMKILDDVDPTAN